MASARAQEASSSTSGCAYQVFLSFRGTETRKTFTGHLYTALVQAGIHTFRDDDEIERGEKIKTELENGIKQSRASIIVFSKDYASSRWCLNELVMILERRSVSGHVVVLPVFYDVDPCDIRHQLGSIGKAFERYQEKLEKEIDDKRKIELTENVKAWKKALREAADLSGMELKNQANGDESKFIQKVVNVIQDKLSRKVLNLASCLVGIHSRVRNINLWIQDGSTDASIMVISGMGGIGKTTIAKFVFNRNFEKFAGSSFLLNIRERSKEPKGLIDLQKQLLSDIFKRKKEKIYNIDEGVNKIRDVIGCKKSLLVLDDVDHINQLNAIFSMQDRFFPGSKIIITTRHECLLKAYRAYEVHRVEKLSNDESIELFSLLAFKQIHPTESYVEPTEKIVAKCGGLPLALQVLGSSLFGKNLDVWESQLKKLETIGNSEIVEKLKISFDSLQDDDVKNIFLHIACFFVGKDRDWTVKILDACDLHTVVGIDHLVDQCLLEIDYSNKIVMHQLIRDVGRDIVRQESSEPGKRSRLWYPQDCCGVLREKTGTETIIALAFDMQTCTKGTQVQSLFCANNTKKRCFEEHFDWINALKRRASSLLSWYPGGNTGINSNDMDLKTDAFSRMHQLKLLQLNNVELSGSYREFPKKLRWLCWQGFHLEFIPNELSLQSLVCLDMQYSRLKLVWKQTKFLQELKILNLGYSRWLAKSPDFLGLPNLEILILKGCVNLVEVCESIGFVEGLSLLDLKDCKRLSKLPQNISRLRLLEELIISGCSSLGEFPMGLRNLESLKVFRADGTDMNALLLSPTKEISRWASFPRFLGELSLRDCNLSNDCFPSFSNLSLLKKMDLSKNLIISLPDCFRTLGMLDTLWLDGCPLLQSVVGLPMTVKYLLGEAYKGFEKGLVHGKWDEVRISCFGCPRLTEVEGCFKLAPIRNVDQRIIRNLGLLDLLPTLTENMEADLFNDIKVRSEYGIFSTCVRGREVPECFSFRKRESSSISFTVPSPPNNNRILGLSVGWVYASGPAVFRNYHRWTRPIVRICNQTKSLTWSYSPTNFEVIEYGVVWLSHWKLGTLLEGGDKVTVSIQAGKLKIKECGVKVVDNIDDMVEDNSTSQQLLNGSTCLSWTEQTLLELSNFHKPGTSYYFNEEDADFDETNANTVRRFVDWRGTYYDDSHCDDDNDYDVSHWDDGYSIRSDDGYDSLGDDDYDIKDSNPKV